MSNSSPDQTYLQNNPQEINEIDIRQVFNTLIRRWRWIAGSSSLGLIFSCIHLITAERIYQGEFQIVISQSGNSSVFALLEQNNKLTSLLNRGKNNSIGTELQILRSPSVLRPVFEEVKKLKPHKANSMQFETWAKTAITAEEKEQGTSVLNVEYRDTNKKIVLPITQLIAETYKSYSNRGRARELNNSISYLKDQIDLMKPQAERSSRAALEYGYTNNLGMADGLPLAGNISGGGMLQSDDSSGSTISSSISGGIESARSAAQRKIIALEVQISEATKAKADSIYYASQLTSLTKKSSTYDKLTLVETRLAELRSRFRDNDPLIQRLERERKTLINYINDQTIALLNGELDLANAHLQALYRPKSVISRHRELTQKALRDEATLVMLHNQLNQYELEQARATSPWELISSPTLREKPVAPSKKKSLGLGLLGGLFLGCGAALIQERRSDLVFSEDELKSLLPCPLLKHLPALAQDTWTNAADLLASGPLAKVSGEGSIALIPLGMMSSYPLQDFSRELARALNGRELIVSTDLRETCRCSTQLVVTAPGVATRTEISQFCEKLSLQGAPIAGWILFDPDIDIG